MTTWQPQLFSWLHPLSSLEYKDLAEGWPAVLLKAYSLNRAAAKTAVWSLYPLCRYIVSIHCADTLYPLYLVICLQPGVTLTLPELCAVGDTETLCSPVDEKCLGHGPEQHMHTGSARPRDELGLKAKLMCAWENQRHCSPCWYLSNSGGSHDIPTGPALARLVLFTAIF